MAQIAEQWPLLGGFLVVTGGVLLLMRGMYERERGELRADLKEERQISKDATAIVGKLSERLDAVLAHYEQRERGR